ncbi:hypothetical protein Ddye_031280 [Dipteronia dyeriana]|uniref:Uncharacterized protein n=1 Tax=Dipteronia dyeriana TaxID=168575 RepID=A0AAD9TIZ7_9ROSI|nr:hypothetical protein Ddye_031280 [Dipteronia dyeriana]
MPSLVCELEKFVKNECLSNSLGRAKLKTIIQQDSFELCCMDTGYGYNTIRRYDSIADLVDDKNSVVWHGLWSSLASLPMHLGFFTGLASYCWALFLCRINRSIMEPGNNAVQVTIDIDYSEIPKADGHSDTDEPNSGLDAPFRFFTDNGMLKVDEASNDYSALKKIFLFGMRSVAEETRIVGIYKNMSSSLIGQARLKSFKIFMDAMARKCVGNAIVTLACTAPPGTRFVRFSVTGSAKLVRSLETAKLMAMASICPMAKMDENGLRHVLFCRVILGNMETVPTGSGQFHPSIPEYDSGVDNLGAPSRFCQYCTNCEPIVVKGFDNNQNSIKANKIPWGEFELKVAEVSGVKLLNTIPKLGGHSVGAT